jgi:hypothetical protein
MIVIFDITKVHHNNETNVAESTFVVVESIMNDIPKPEKRAPISHLILTIKVASVKGQ